MKLTLKNWRLTNREKAFAEHLLYGVVVAGWTTEKYVGSHDYKKIALGAIAGGILSPLIARLNPLSLANKISNETGAPAPLVQVAVNDAVQAADKFVVENSTPAQK